MHIDDLLDSHIALPSIPRVIAIVLSELNRDEPDLRKISQEINTDPGMTACVLRLANSAQFQLTQRVGSVSDALALLGFDQVRSLAIAAGLSVAFKKVPGVDMQQFWRYSLDVAKLSRKLAHDVRVNASTAFTTGLLHATGELVMHLGMPEQMLWLNAQAGPFTAKRAKAEHKLLGYTYAAVGGRFAQTWQFPARMVDAITNQLNPFVDGNHEALAGIVHLAAWRARAQEEGQTAVAMLGTFPSEVASTLGIDIDGVLAQSPIEWTTSQEAATVA